MLPTTSQLSFWHGTPEINEISELANPKPYYMKFHYKANYNGHYDEKGIPMLNYHGNIGLQYNPIAIAQYGLGNYNLYLDTNDQSRLIKFYAVADWMVEHLEPNDKGIFVWNHYFDFEYRSTLHSPWYSGLAQGLGLSLLLRAFQESNDQKYMDAHEKAWFSFTKDVDEGGVMYTDDNSDLWIEEYIVDPPTHILNGFIWALWGVYDTWKYLNNTKAKDLFFQCCDTIEKNLYRYDQSYWSLYEQSGTILPMLASPFYHHVHIVQLIILSRLTGRELFKKTAEKWESYTHTRLNYYRAFLGKALFKVLYY